MILHAYQEPSLLEPNAEPIGDFFTDGQRYNDAVRGSRRLLRAVLNLRQPVKGKRACYGPRPSSNERKAKFAQIERIKLTVAKHFKLPPETMTKGRGPADQVEPRQVAMFLARHVVKASYPEIAMCFGGKDHTTVIYACRMVEEKPHLAKKAAKLRLRLGA